MHFTNDAVTHFGRESTGQEWGLSQTTALAIDSASELVIGQESSKLAGLANGPCPCRNRLERRREESRIALRVACLDCAA